MLITSGKQSPEIILQALAAQGESLTAATEKKPFDAWKVRSMLGLGGQSLQLVSAFLRPPTALTAGKGVTKHLDSSILVFAASNLAANAINLIYDHGQQVDDVHQLEYLKQRVNRELSPHLMAGEAAPNIHDRRQALRPDETQHRPLDNAKGFLKKHSVTVGELGLRYLGAIGLAFPARYWKDAFATKTFPRMDSSKLRVYTGLSSIFGKTVALSSKIPDPYNPAPETWMDTMREKVSFLAGGFIEITSFSALAYDCFFNSSGPKPQNQARGLFINGKHHRDWLGVVGASMFVMGYIARSWAPFGERKVNMDELCAHVSDTLAKTPSEKTPQLLANTTASLAEHLKDQPASSFAEIYTRLANDFTRYHSPKTVDSPLADKEKNHLKSKSQLALTPPQNRPTHRVLRGNVHADGMVAPIERAISS